MGNKYEKKELLIDCGREEFLKHGYEKASLRAICDRAGVTTGALYFLFKNKADLFDTIVRDIAIRAQEMVEKQITASESSEDNFDIQYSELADFLCLNGKELTLLCMKSEGTKYEGFLNRIEEMSRKGLHKIFMEKCGEDVDPNYALLISKMMVTNCTILINRELEADEAEEILRNMFLFQKVGINALIDSLKSNK